MLKTQASPDMDFYSTNDKNISRPIATCEGCLIQYCDWACPPPNLTWDLMYIVQLQRVVLQVSVC